MMQCLRARDLRAAKKAGEAQSSPRVRPRESIFGLQPPNDADTSSVPRGGSIGKSEVFMRAINRAGKAKLISFLLISFLFVAPDCETSSSSPGF